MLVVLLWIAALATAGAAIYESLPHSRTGIAFTHANGLTPRRRLPESIAPGMAISITTTTDLYFVNSAGPNALYRNDDGMRFTNVTNKAGVPGNSFGLGVTTCDYNRDGWTDLFISAHGRNTLYRNDGDGTFTDTTREAGLDAQGLWTAAVFSMSAMMAMKISLPDISSLTCRDRACMSRIALHPGKVFGAVATDVNDDGLLDLFVANDSVANFFFVNRGEAKFDEVGLDAGVAYSGDEALPARMIR